MESEMTDLRVVDAVLKRDPALGLPPGFHQYFSDPQQCARIARPPTQTDSQGR